MPKKENTGTSGTYRIHRSVVWFSSRRCLDALAGNIYTNWLLSLSADNQKSIHLSSYIYAPTFGFVLCIFWKKGTWISPHQVTPISSMVSLEQ